MADSVGYSVAWVHWPSLSTIPAHVRVGAEVGRSSPTVEETLDVEIRAERSRELPKIEKYMANSIPELEEFLRLCQLSFGTRPVTFGHAVDKIERMSSKTDRLAVSYRNKDTI